MLELWHSTVPGFDCLSRGHLWVEHHAGEAHASWCLWCGSGASNEHDEPDAWRPSRASQTGSYTVYPLLDRLEDSKQVTGEYREQPGGKARRVYALTPEGRKAALGFLELED